MVKHHPQMVGVTRMRLTWFRRRGWPWRAWAAPLGWAAMVAGALVVVTVVAAGVTETTASWRRGI